MYFQHNDEAKEQQGIRFTTKHGFLILTGFVAEALGLRKVLAAGLHIKQKVYQHTPVDKVLQALVGILGGCRGSQCCPGLGPKGVRPLLHRVPYVAGVHGTGRTNPIGSPWLHHEASAGARPQQTGWSGRPGAAFLHTGTDRFAVAGLLKPGNAHCANCLLELIPNIEAVVGRPRRRVEFVQQCVDEIQKRITQIEHDLQILGKGPGMPQRRKALERRLEEQQQYLAVAKVRLEQYRVANAMNPAPRRVALCADSAFGTTEAIQLCLELGYDLVMKRYSVTPYREVFDAAPPESWTDAGKKRKASEILPMPAVALLAPFPLRQLAMQRTDVDGRIVRSIVVTTLSADDYPLLGLVRLYEARQSIESALQECKHTFHFGTPRLRSEEANSAYTQLVLFAFNLVRWTEQVTTKTHGRPMRTGSRLWVWTAETARQSSL